MTTEQQQSQDADQTGLGQMNAARSAPAEKSPAETAAMNEAAKEASMMLLDKLLGGGHRLMVASLLHRVARGQSRGEALVALLACRLLSSPLTMLSQV